MANSDTNSNIPDNTDLNISISFKVSGTPTGLLTLTGIIDKPNLKLLRSSINVCLAENKKYVIIDMSNIRFVGSAGWGYLIAENERLKQLGGHLLLTGLQSDVQRIYSSLQIEHAIKALPTIDGCHKEIQNLADKVLLNTDQISLISYVDSGKSAVSSLKDVHNDTEDITLSQKESKKIDDRTIKEYIIHIISTYGPGSFLSIKKHLDIMLNGKEKVHMFKLLKILRDMDLDSSEKRRRFFRSC